MNKSKLFVTVILSAVSASPVLADLGGSASGGDIRPKVPAFEYTCQVHYFDSESKVSADLDVTINDKNWQQSQGNDHFQLMMRPQHSDFDQANINTVDLRVFSDDRSHSQRSQNVFLLSQGRLEISAWNEHTGPGPGFESLRQGATAKCRLKGWKPFGG